LISKVYFPRLVISAASAITSFVDFLISAASWYFDKTERSFADVT
jgi:hypothetical protein